MIKLHFPTSLENPLNVLCVMIGRNINKYIAFCVLKLRFAKRKLKISHITLMWISSNFIIFNTYFIFIKNISTFSRIKINSMFISAIMHVIIWNKNLISFRQKRFGHFERSPNQRFWTFLSYLSTLIIGKSSKLIWSKLLARFESLICRSQS